MVVKAHHHRSGLADHGPDPAQDLGLGIIEAGIDHRAMKVEKHCVDRQGLRQHAGQLADDALKGLIGHRAARTATGPDQRHGFVAGAHGLQKPGDGKRVAAQTL